ncbi:FG-GAP repeat domain-containing protein, partial [Pyxidicoccus sp. 3LFB2]
STVDLLALTDTGDTTPARALVLLRGNGDGTFAAAEPLAEGTAPIRVVAGDVDADGDLDVFCLGTRLVDDFVQYTVWHLRNAGDGTFAPAVALKSGYFVFDLAMGDMNQDGRLDLAVLVDGNMRYPSYPYFAVGLFEAQPDGSLTWRAERSSGGNCQLQAARQRLLVAELDGEGALDIVTSCATGAPSPFPFGWKGDLGGVVSLWNWGDVLGSSFGRYNSLGGETTGLASRDLDGDGQQEVLAASPGLPGVCVVPSRSLQPLTEPLCFAPLATPQDVGTVDVDHDGVPELLVDGGDSGGTVVLRPR